MYFFNCKTYSFIVPPPPLPKPIGHDLKKFEPKLRIFNINFIFSCSVVLQKKFKKQSLIQCTDLEVGSPCKTLISLEYKWKMKLPNMPQTPSPTPSRGNSNNRWPPPPPEKKFWILHEYSVDWILKTDVIYFVNKLPLRGPLFLFCFPFNFPALSHIYNMKWKNSMYMTFLVCDIWLFFTIDWKWSI